MQRWLKRSAGATMLAAGLALGQEAAADAAGNVSILEQNLGNISAGSADNWHSSKDFTLPSNANGTVWLRGCYGTGGTGSWFLSVRRSSTENTWFATPDFGTDVRGGCSPIQGTTALRHGIGYYVRYVVHPNGSAFSTRLSIWQDI